MLGLGNPRQAWSMCLCTRKEEGAHKTKDTRTHQKTPNGQSWNRTSCRVLPQSIRRIHEPLLVQTNDSINKGEEDVLQKNSSNTVEASPAAEAHRHRPLAGAALKDHFQRSKLAKGTKWRPEAQAGRLQHGACNKRALRPWGIPAPART